MKMSTPKKITLPIESSKRLLDNTKNISIGIYLIIGLTFLIEGVRTIFENPYVCLPIQANHTEDSVLYLFGLFQRLLHLFIDLSITFIFVGCIAIWASLNYVKSNIVDLILFIYFFLHTLIHWNASFDEDRAVSSPLISLIPIILIIAITILKKRQKDSNDS